MGPAAGRPASFDDLVGDLLQGRRHIEADCGGQKIPIRFSAGWVGYELGETTEQFLDRADRTLYAEKRARKARIKELVPVA